MTDGILPLVENACRLPGSTCEKDLLKGLLLGFALAAAVTLTAELTRHAMQRRRSSRDRGPRDEAAVTYERLPCASPGPLR